MARYPRILVFGVGSVGAVYLYILHSAGAEVCAVCRSNNTAASEDGFEINSTVYGNVRITPDVVRSPADAEGLWDYIVITSKACPGSKPTTAELVRPAVRPPTTIVLIQNGVGIEQEWADAFPNNPILSCVVYMPATQIKPGVISHTEMELLEIGTYRADASAAHKQVAVSFSSIVKKGGGTAEVYEDIQEKRWSKLLLNASWNAICALSKSRDVAFLTASSTAATFTKNVMLEIASIAQKAGYEEIDSKMVEEQFARSLQRQWPGVQTSMLFDILHGRALEVEAILGNTVRIAQDLQVPTPLLDGLYSMVKALDESESRLRSGSN